MSRRISINGVNTFSLDHDNNTPHLRLIVPRPKILRLISFHMAHLVTLYFTVSLLHMLHVVTVVQCIITRN